MVEYLYLYRYSTITTALCLYRYSTITTALCLQIVSIQRATDHALNRREIIVVSSGSVAHGRSRARKEMYMNVSFKNLQQINLRKVNQ